MRMDALRSFLIFVGTVTWLLTGPEGGAGLERWAGHARPIGGSPISTLLRIARRLRWPMCLQTRVATQARRNRSFAHRAMMRSGPRIPTPDELDSACPKSLRVTSRRLSMVERKLDASA